MKNDIIAPPTARPNDWVSALEAVHLLAATLGDVIAKETLISRMADCCLQIAGEIVLQECDEGRADVDAWLWNEPLKRIPHQSRQLPNNPHTAWRKVGYDNGLPIIAGKDFFSLQDSWMIDIAHLGWSQGVVVARRRVKTLIRVPQKPVDSAELSEWLKGGSGHPTTATIVQIDLRRAVIGLHFHRQEILAMVMTSPLPPLRTEAGAEVLGYNWGAGLRHLDELIATHRMGEMFESPFSPGVTGSIADFLRVKAARPGGKQPSRRAAYDHARKVVDRWQKKMGTRR